LGVSPQLLSKFPKCGTNTDLGWPLLFLNIRVNKKKNFYGLSGKFILSKFVKFLADLGSTTWHNIELFCGKIFFLFTRFGSL
jgi:hypothetical protein